MIIIIYKGKYILFTSLKYFDSIYNFTGTVNHLNKDQNFSKVFDFANISKKN